MESKFTVFSASDFNKWFSEKAIDIHLQLYSKYVESSQLITSLIKGLENFTGNYSYSPYSELLRRQAVAYNGAVLHQKFFSDLLSSNFKKSTAPDVDTDLFQRVLGALNSGPGWVLIDKEGFVTFVEEHHRSLLADLDLNSTILIDSWEHAYLIDFGINRKDYLLKLWSDLPWHHLSAKSKVVHAKSDMSETHIKARKALDELISKIGIPKGISLDFVINIQIVRGSENWVARTLNLGEQRYLIQIVDGLSDEDIPQVVAHEFAHVYSGLDTGSIDENHGESFRKVALKINSLYGDGYVATHVDYTKWLKELTPEVVIKTESQIVASNRSHVVIEPDCYLLPNEYLVFCG